ncbi:MAG TPA: sigma-54 dependent transcriptional regulator [Gammaproteobacteria bacterium]|nr:sigma-54 dependent transcriptional regulator [Gammaproteobacteria bacterium]
MSEAGNILVVEDDGDLATLLTDELSEAGYGVRTSDRAEAAEEEMARGQPELILSDLRLPGMSGLDFLHRVNTYPEPPAFLLVTAFGTIPQAVEALKAGADDFLTKPLDLEHLHLRVARTLDNHRLRQEIASYRRAAPVSHFHDLVGQSPAMLRLYDQIRMLSQAGGPVLLQGESGSGKELVARAVHQESPRGSSPFVAVNCASIPGELMESELFGHKGGAFTGATGSRRGLFAEAHGGTLFLDEIGEMPAALQATLLRVLQDGRIRPVGGEKEESVDVRVVTATNRDLSEEMTQGNFRPDLFYRLETFSLTIPPLRERGEDLELLAGRFIAQFARDLNRKNLHLTEDALDCLKNYPFPGNVRELRNAMERAATFAQDERIRPAELPERIREAAATVPPPSAADASAFLEEGFPTLEELNRRYIDHVLEYTGGNKRWTAKILGVSRRTLYRHLDRH